MTDKKILFGKASAHFYFDASFSILKKIASPKQTIIITDENVFTRHSQKLKGYNTIVLKSGEGYKTQQTVDAVIQQLIQFNADRSTTLVGIGGGVITDITGYVASIYMRGIHFGLVPTSLLAIVDASIGGKNGVDVGLYKNMVGTIRQPDFIIQDAGFLQTLPLSEWQNGFAEIIKHACIKDADMFIQLQENSIDQYQKNKKLLSNLLQQNSLIKIKVVQKDPFEKGERKLLNFGHTLGHAIENKYELSHGQAISIGMTYAAELSEQILGFKQKEKLAKLLQQYGLPTYAKFNTKKVFEIMRMDKKKSLNDINYILLQKIGKAQIVNLPINKLEKLIAAV